MAGTKFIPGGATQNSMRVAQWCLRTEKKDDPKSFNSYASYMGCVGKDDYAKKMLDASKDLGVTTHYMEDEATATGTCAVLVNGDKGARSLIANLAAANNYKDTHLEKPENWALVEKAQVVYSAGFFLTVSPPSMMKVATHCMEKNKLYCLNIAAPFLCQVPPFKSAMMEVMPMVDYLFGNETEAAAFAESEGWTEKSVEAIACKMSMLPTKKAMHRTVVITQGVEPTIVAKYGRAVSYAITPLPKEAVKDTNGAGDAFVGGFLAKLVQGCSIDVCCKAGAESAKVIVQNDGCTFPVSW